MKEPLLVITTEDKSTMKLDELLKEVQECIHTPRAASLMLDVAVRPLPRFTRGLRKEKKKFEELERKAGRGNGVWDYCEERIGKIDSELSRRSGRAILIVAVLTLIVAAAALGTAFLFGYRILPPSGTPTTSVEGKQ